MHGFGPVIEETNEPNFHAEWEARALAMVVAMGPCGQWNLDQSRHARESLPPADYMRYPYYRIWTEALETLLLERGMVLPAELSEGKALEPGKPVKGVMTADRVDELLAKGGPVDRPAASQPAFAVGETIRTINDHPTGHTRLPRYARARSGKITKVLGHHVFPDTNALGEGEQPCWLYQVRFTANELWG
ncbi:MAG: nitrile hydratase subunit beta, partial [Pseudomonadota bacterium]